MFVTQIPIHFLFGRNLFARIVGASVHLIADPVLLQPYLQELMPLLEVRMCWMNLMLYDFGMLPALQVFFRA